MNNGHEYTPKQIFNLYLVNELEQSTAANYLAFQKKWKSRELSKLKDREPSNLESINELKESIEKIQDYMDIVLDYIIKEDIPSLSKRIQLSLNNADIARLFRDLKKYKIINCTAIEFSTHFTNIDGKDLPAGFINSLKGAAFSSNKLLEAIEKFVGQS